MSKQRTDFPRMMVWDKNESSAVSRIVVCNDLSGKKPVIVVKKPQEKRWLEGASGLSCLIEYEHCKPICEHGSANYGAKCECGEIRPLTEKMQKFIDKYGTEKKWAREGWPEGEYIIFSGEFSLEERTVAVDERGVRLDSVYITKYTEYKEPKKETVPWGYEEYAERFPLVVIRKGEVDKRRPKLMVTTWLNSQGIDVRGVISDFREASEMYVLPDGSPLTKEVGE